MVLKVFPQVLKVRGEGHPEAGLGAGPGQGGGEVGQGRVEGGQRQGDLVWVSIFNAESTDSC